MKSAQWTVGLVVVGALAVSCNALTGLSDYEKVDCVGPCGDAGDAGSDVVTGPDADAGKDVLADVADEDALEADVVDADVVDVTYEAIELEPVEAKLRWAQWRMPHEEVWDVPDAGEAGPPFAADASMVDAPGGPLFVDYVTGLTWMPSGNDQGSQDFGLEEANGFCVGQQWRLPTRIELVTLFEPEKPNQIHSALSGDVCSAGAYWTSSRVFSAPGEDADVPSYWVVDFQSGGGVKTRIETGEACVRCVKKSN